MIALALVPIALVLGWLGTLCLSRDMANVELKDFVIATGGASCMGLVGMPQLGIAVLGDHGVRLAAVVSMILAAVLTLVVANLLRGRGVRCGARHSALHLPRA
jgi:hypothetical protein